MGSLSCYYWARMREQQRLVHNTFTKICFILLVNFVITIDSVITENQGSGHGNVEREREARRMKQTSLSREQGLALLRKYNKEPFHILHGLTVEGVMEWYAEQLGYGDEKAFWGMAGLLHDIDFELYPEEHCERAPELLRDGGAEEDLVHAVVSHGYGIRVDVAPEHEMEKVLFAADELTGLIWAAAKMRPSKSTKDMELSSLKKKFKDKKFAAGCSRDVIRRGADQLGWELDKLMEQTILAMRSCEDRVNKEMEELEF